MCLFPHTYTYTDGYGLRRSVQGPCGHCVQCLTDYQNSWKIRLSDEFAVTCKGVFATLTYSPAAAVLADPSLVQDEFSKLLPTRDKRPLTLQMSDVRSWLKRCRERWFRAVGKRPKFKYFACGEYGPTTLRPHYHCFFTGISLQDFKQYFQSDWEKRFGFVDSSALVLKGDKSPQRVANYVSKYCAKGMFESPRVKKYPDLFEKPRRCMSKGIGRQAAEKLSQQYVGKFGLSFMRPRYALNNEFNFHPSKFYRNESEQYDKVFRYFGRRPKPKKVSKIIDSKYWRRSPVTGRYRKLTKYETILEEQPRSLYKSFIPRFEILERLCNSFSLSFSDPSGKTFTYKMPRYYRSIILGNDSPLAAICSRYLQARACTDYSNKLEELQAAHPSWSPAETLHALEVSAYSERKRRAFASQKSLNKFYSQSKF